PELGVGDPPLAVDDGDAPGVGRERALERVAQRDARPVPPLAVATRERLRPGHEAVKHRRLRRLPPAPASTARAPPRRPGGGPAPRRPAPRDRPRPPPGRRPRPSPRPVPRPR